jgi:hypothetical protein
VRSAGRQLSIAVSTKLRSEIFSRQGLDKTAKQLVTVNLRVRSMTPAAAVWHDRMPDDRIGFFWAFERIVAGT